ncbi:MAG: asparagine synthase (glutamine-hydrolyzing), partial [Candidatus Omnitrophica bacterium]|nr:asparagine synthase (glutamine-hydrolyzing) [Candidatus Omnitrophota bacterium]
MCGIVGFIAKENPDLIKTMADSIRHRGPDDEGFFHQGNVHLGMRRLSIVDLLTGKQPVHNEDRKIWTVFNGEIYNHALLRRELEQLGHHFYTDHSDTENIVHLYEERGEQFVNEINGMFAIALWDETRQKLLLYRDRLGKKPLYYSLKAGRFAFASEIKSLIQLPWVSKDLDFVSLSDYFSRKHISAPRTAYQDIHQLLPGEYLIYQNGVIELKNYWQLDFGQTLPVSEEEAKEKILELLDDAVSLRMKCDVPFGAYLSGGLDSSIIVSLMKRHQTKPVKTFSLGYEDVFSGKQTDLYFARQMSRQLATEHHEYFMSAREVPEMLHEVMKAFDEPFSGTISTYFLSLLIRKHVKVALSGDGADELFGSYLTHRLAQPVANFVQLTKEKQENLAALNSQERLSLVPFDTPDQFGFLKNIAHSEASVWRSRLDVFSEEEKNRLFVGGGMTQSDCFHTTARDPLNQILEMDQKGLLPNQVLPFVDRLSMAHSIEVRVPFLDYRLVEFAAALPGRMKI